MSHWSNFKEQSAGYFRLQLVLKIYQIFGKKTAQFFLYPIVFFIFIFAGRARKYSLLYLKKIYQFKLNRGDNSLTKPNYFSSFKHFIFFANSLLDRVESWFGDLSSKKINVKTVATLEEILAAIDQNHGPFFICSHLGNVEALRAFANIQGERKIVVNSLVQISHTPDFNNLLRKINPNFSINLISATEIGIDSVISIKEKLQKGEVVVAAGDRTAAKNAKKVVTVNFLGEKAHFPVGTFTLASLMESQIYFVFFLKSEDSTNKNEAYDFYLYKAETSFISRAKREENLEKIVGEYVTHLENLCLKYPYQWYNFFDFWE